MPRHAKRSVKFGAVEGGEQTLARLDQYCGGDTGEGLAAEIASTPADPPDYFGGHGPAYGATAALPRQIITRSILSSGLSE